MTCLAGKSAYSRQRECRARWSNSSLGPSAWRLLSRRTSLTVHANNREANTLVTLEEVQVVAQQRGLELSVKDLGPFYRVVCRDGGQDGPVVGVTAGFVAPLLGIMHCDTLQIFTRGLRGEKGQRVRGGALGLGLLLGGATFAYGHQRGCRTAEILAINDDDAWHARLVRYYSYFGFRPVCSVGGNGLADLPHMLVWGGEGTRMDADIQAMLRKWTPALRRSREGGEGGDDGEGEGEGEEEAVGGVQALR